MRKLSIQIVFMFIVLIVKSQNVDSVDFEKLNKPTNWTLKFLDPGTGNWNSNWFLDGKLAKVENTDNGMSFTAGPENGNDAHHAVLWTKNSFEGDVKIEFTYTRTDSEKRNVNILYIQATGTGIAPYSKDISLWNDLRKAPAMKIYFNHMNALHISFAAFTNDGLGDEYVRARRYPATPEHPFKDTGIPPSFDNTGLFLSDVTYKITVIKTTNKLFFNVEGKDVNRVFSWDLKAIEPISGGRIGLRHMYTRSAIYKDFKVYVRN